MDNGNTKSPVLSYKKAVCLIIYCDRNIYLKDSISYHVYCCNICFYDVFDI